MSKFGEMVREMRHQKSMTLEQLAKKLGTHKGYISGWETGKLGPPRPEFVEKLCEVFGLNYPRMLAISFAEKAPAPIREKFVEMTLATDWE